MQTFESFLNESKYVSITNEGLDPDKVEKLLDDLHAQSQKVKDSDYKMVEIKKLDAIEREAVKMGLTKAIGSAWHKDKTPKEVHDKYKEYGYEWMGESVNELLKVDMAKIEDFVDKLVSKIKNGKLASEIRKFAALQKIDPSANFSEIVGNIKWKFGQEPELRNSDIQRLLSTI